jgi:hypothetical protein
LSRTTKFIKDTFTYPVFLLVRRTLINGVGFLASFVSSFTALLAMSNGSLCLGIHPIKPGVPSVYADFNGVVGV